MATNKNQHFVPRCYLKAFTVNANNHVINLFNIDRQQLIRNAPVKNQCSRDYFYGKDPDLEAAIQQMEGLYAKVFKEISKPGYKLSDSHKICLLKFWLFQNMRTEAAARKALELSESLTRFDEITVEQFKLEINDAVLLAMQSFAEGIRSVDDLKLCLLRNRTSIPFITSDNPAIITNKWWLGDHRTKGRSFGLSSAGALVMLPLSPELLIVGYDGDVYSMPHKAGIVNVTRENDCIAINQHQILNARANLFIQNADHLNVIQPIIDDVISSRPTHHHVINYAIPDLSTATHTRYKVVSMEHARKHGNALVHYQINHPVPTKWPSLISIRNSGKIFTNDSAVGYVRYTVAQSKQELKLRTERP